MSQETSGLTVGSTGATAAINIGPRGRDPRRAHSKIPGEMPQTLLRPLLFLPMPMVYENYSLHLHPLRKQLIQIRNAVKYPEQLTPSFKVYHCFLIIKAIHMDFFQLENSKNKEERKRKSTRPNNPTPQTQFGSKLFPRGKS